MTQLSNPFLQFVMRGCGLLLAQGKGGGGGGGAPGATAFLRKVPSLTGGLKAARSF